MRTHRVWLVNGRKREFRSNGFTIDSNGMMVFTDTGHKVVAVFNWRYVEEVEVD